MIKRKIALSATLCLVFTSLWLLFMILSVIKTGPIVSLADAIDSINNPGILFYLSYINAVFVTITVTIFFGYLYRYCKALDADSSLLGIIFIPIYSFLNLFVYLSQITIVPRLLSLMDVSSNPHVYEVLIGQFVQGWSQSFVSVLNQLGYAILGVPSIVFGLVLIKHHKISSFGGWLFVGNGVACIVGFLGTILNNQLLAFGSVVGGVLFIIAILVVRFKIFR